MKRSEEEEEAVKKGQSTGGRTHIAVGHERVVLFEQLDGELRVRADGAAAQQENLSVLQQPVEHLSRISQRIVIIIRIRTRASRTAYTYSTRRSLFDGQITEHHSFDLMCSVM